MSKKESVAVQVGDKEITFETGQIAKQANGAIIVRCGETILFCSACASKNALENVDFLPLRVDYQEKFSAAGKTVGGFFKREGRPREKEVLTCRLIDRPLRPLFPDGYHNEVQILSYVWSYDGEVTTEPLAICGASAALAISQIPLKKTVGAVRVGKLEGKLVVNPSPKQMESSCLDLVLAGTEDSVMMIEGYCDFLTEEEVMEAIEEGHKEIQKICQAIDALQKKVGKEKDTSTVKPIPEEVFTQMDATALPLITEALQITDKLEREIALTAVKEQVMEKLLSEEEGTPFTAQNLSAAFKKSKSQLMRNKILSEGKRSDGRALDEIRPISIEQGFLPRTHGSSVFTRGETQAVAVCTLGGGGMAQRFETLDEDGLSSFYLQYSFPPFSVGEVRRTGSPGRREIGHGKLAERSLQAVLPTKDAFPYTIRIESNITESNGSSSMASVCGGSLAMMNAGVPIKRPVSGIAMGLILENREKFTVLSDILGLEDALGDMDFKITGDRDGIAAFQMDIKVEGITHEIMRTALTQAKQGRVHILEKMLEACPKPNNMSKHAPRIETLRVKPSKIAVVIGPGGKQIRAIIQDCGVEVDIDDDGFVSISSPNAEGVEKAKAIIEGLIAEAEVGKTYEGKITSIVNFGMFVEILPGKEGLCHISEFGHERVNSLEEHVKEGEMVSVKLLDINDRGQLRLSRKALLTKPS